MIAPFLKTVDDVDFAIALLAIDKGTRMGDLRSAAVLSAISIYPLFLPPLPFAARLKQQNDSILFAERAKLELRGEWSTN